LTKWDDIFKAGSFGLKEPDKFVVDFSRVLKERKAKTVLDLGCGAGRNLIFFVREGFDVYGLDISKVALRKAKETLSQEGFSTELKNADMTALPYISEFFDAIVCIYVIYHNTLEGMRKAIAEIHRSLKKKGLALLVFQSRRSWKYRLGKQIEQGTFVQTEEPEKGVIHHFSDEHEIKHLLSEFRILDMKLDEFEFKGRLHSHWIAMIEK
jgi:cyclopropane fatty-acyl-phospholipid synthase-like methyltransferase